MTYEPPFPGGAAYPFPREPGPRTYSSHPAFRPVAGSSIRGYATAAQLALAAVAIAVGYELVCDVRQLSVAGKILTDPRSVTLAQASAADHAATTSGRIALAVFVVTAIVFVVWFWHARLRAEGVDRSVHRRSRPWTVWGWICPVVNLWFPRQITVDILRASDAPSYDRVNWRERRHRLIEWWWAFYLLRGFASIYGLGYRGNDLQTARQQLTTLRDGLRVDIFTEGSRPREWCLSRPPRDLGLDFMR